MTPATMNALGVIACLIGAVLMWLPFKSAGAHHPMAWNNPLWHEDIQNIRFLSAACALAFCAAGAVFGSRAMGL